MLNGWIVATIAVLDVGTKRNDLMRSTEPSWLKSLKNLCLFCVDLFCRPTKSNTDVSLQVIQFPVVCRRVRVERLGFHWTDFY